jgi:hypothetical protein
MNNQNGMMKRIAKLGLILMLGSTISACSSSMRWKEEVLQHDGSKLIVERMYNLGGYRGLESHERTELDETITFNLLDSNKRVTWKTDFRDSEPEPNSLNLLLVDVVKGVPYIATYPAGCIAYNKWQRPNPPYVFFKYADNNWKQISLAEFPVELNKINVMIGGPQRHDPKSFYTVNAVDSENARVRQPEYKTILREPVKGATEDCPEMIRIGNGGWDGIGWFRDQPSKEACLKYCVREEVSAQNCPCNRFFKGAK